MKKLTPGLAIRSKCLDCHGYSKNETRKCGFADCPLYPHRLGKNPNRIGCGQEQYLKMAHHTKIGSNNDKYPIVSQENTESDAIRSLVNHPLKAIRKYCMGCSLDNQYEIAKCVSQNCPVYIYRFGRKPTLSEIDDYLNGQTVILTECEADVDLNKHTKLVIEMVKWLRRDYVDGV